MTRSPITGGQDSSRVLLTLAEHSHLSRKDLEYLCALSRPTIDKVLRTLLRYRLAVRDGYQASARGRRSSLFKFNERHKYALGVDFEIPQLNLILSDLSGRTIRRRALKLLSEGWDDPQSVITFVAQRVRRFMAQAHLPLERIIGLGFGAPALLQDGTLTLLGETLPAWRKVPVKAMLEDELGVPVLLGHDAGFMALTESTRRRDGEHVVAYLTLRQGAYGDIRMGGAVLIDGRVYWGAHGNAISLREAYVKLKKSAQHKLALSAKPVVAIDSRELRDLLQEHLWSPVLNLVTLFDPERLIIQARLLKAEEEPFLEHLTRRLKAHLGEAFRFEVLPAQEGDWACAQGAALYVLQGLFSDSEHLIERLTAARPQGGR